jgi:hypothetical protein
MADRKVKSARAAESRRRRVSKVLAQISYEVVSTPLNYEQLVALEAHSRLMVRICEEGKR